MPPAVFSATPLLFMVWIDVVVTTDLSNMDHIDIVALRLSLLCAYALLAINADLEWNRSAELCGTVNYCLAAVVVLVADALVVDLPETFISPTKRTIVGCLDAALIGRVLCADVWRRRASRAESDALLYGV